MSTTETKVRHSALPWKAENCHPRAEQGYENWNVLGGESGQTTIAMLPVNGNTEGVRAANAELIARAVNSHADMLKALEGTMEMLRAIRDCLPNEWNTIVEKWRGNGSPSLAVDVWDANKAAIAKAKGGA